MKNAHCLFVLSPSLTKNYHYHSDCNGQQGMPSFGGLCTCVCERETDIPMRERKNLAPGGSSGRRSPSSGAFALPFRRLLMSKRVGHGRDLSRFGMRLIIHENETLSLKKEEERTKEKDSIPEKYRELMAIKCFRGKRNSTAERLSNIRSAL